MRAAAFAAGAAASASGSLPVAFAAALAVGVMLSMVHGLACVTFRGDQVVAGMAITMTCAGLTVALGVAWFHLGGQTPALPDELRLSRWLGGPAGETPMLGLLGHNGLVYTALVLVPLIAWVLDHTRFGLRLQATGENPAMVDAAGVSVIGLRYLALALNGMLCALAGAYLVLAQSPQFVPNMTAGRGYMAMAAMIFGHWRPLGAFGACLLFGFLDALAIRLQGTPLPGLGAVPVQAIQALPYALTVVLLAGFIGRARAPRALGQPYVKER
jgi:simple sugar transport system permease protein